MSTEQAAAPPSAGVHSESTALFARNATGLVRGISPKSSIIINLIPGHPAQSLAAGFFFVFALFPGGSYLLGLAMVIPLVLAISYAFGLLTQMIPRSGGDYMLVSRVIHPGVGLISSFCMTLAGLFSNAFFGLAFVTIGLGPGLVGVGLVSGSHTLVNWGTTIQGSTGWKFALGGAMMCVSALILASGWRLTLRIQNVLFWLVTSSVVLSVLVALFTSKGAFITNFNDFARPYTHDPNTYNSVINSAHKAGVVTNPAFSFKNTIPIMGFFATFSIYSYWSTFVGGEVRQASTMKMANNMALAGVIGVVVVGLCAAIFFHTFGTPFMIAANGGGFPSTIPTAPTYFFLMGASVGNTFFVCLITVTYVLFWPLICYISMIQPTRMVFAYAFDGILPKAVTKTTRTGAPWVATLVALVLSLATFLWAVNSAGFLQILVYATLVQLIAMGLVGLSALIVPWAKPDLYRASTTVRTFLGIPVVSIAGAGAIGVSVLIWVLYFNYKTQFGLTNVGRMFAIFGVTIGLAIVYYVVARTVRRNQGVDLDLVYAEIPPE
ncbi:MAG: amino acid permease [Solirubrobacteraceae bacterium]